MCLGRGVWNLGQLTDKLRNTFSNVIKDYDYARPNHPQEIYNEILEFSKLKQRDDILEVGAGTGQATDLFLRENFNMDLLEVSEDQVKFLKKKYTEKRNIEVFQEYFEDFKPTKEYKVIFSATAFHWIDENIGYPKAWNMLKDGGTMVVFWQMYSVTLVNDDIHKGLYGIKRKYMPNEFLGYDEEGIARIKENRIRRISRYLKE